jgi:hypothetical protein
MSSQLSIASKYKNKVFDLSFQPSRLVTLNFSRAVLLWQESQ